MENSRLKIVTLCTGNVARSVMLAYMLTTIAEENGLAWTLRSAGTHVIEGSAMSSRTKHALERIPELSGHNFNAHRSHQLSLEDLLWCDVVIAAEADNIRSLRSVFPDARDKSVTLMQFLRSAPLDETLSEQLGAVAAMDLDGSLDILDPAGKEQFSYDECADQLWLMAQAFVTLLGSD